jgi:hypothetical protein
VESRFLRVAVAVSWRGPNLEYGASAVFPCGGSRRGVVSWGSRTGQHDEDLSPAGRHGGPRRRKTNLTICPGRTGRVGCHVTDTQTGRSTPRGGPFPLTPPLSHRDAGIVDQTSSRGRGGTRAGASAHVGQVDFTCPGRDDGVEQTMGVGRSSEALQASGLFVGREPRVAAGAATRGYGRVPLQGTCAWGVVFNGEVELGWGDSTSQLTLGRSPGLWLGWTRVQGALGSGSPSGNVRGEVVCGPGDGVWRKRVQR